MESTSTQHNEDPEEALLISLSVLAALPMKNEDLVAKMASISGNHPYLYYRLDEEIQALWKQPEQPEPEPDQPAFKSPGWKSWKDEWMRMGSIIPRLTPFALHSVVTTTASHAQQLSYQGTAQPEDLNNQVKNSESLASQVLFVLTMLLLCCEALEQCPNNPPKFRKRWRSLLLETIRLYQRHLWTIINNTDVHDPLIPLLLQRCIGPWICEAFLPLIQQTQQKLIIPNTNTTASQTTTRTPVNSQSNASHPDAIITMAACVQILSHFTAHMAATSSSLVDSSFASSSSSTIIRPILACLETIIHGRWEWIASHAMVSRQHPTLTIQQHIEFSSTNTSRATTTTEPERRLAYWSCWRDRPIIQTNTPDAQTTNEEYDNIEEVRLDIDESVCFVETVWNTTGIAILLVASWDDGGPMSTVWTPSYRWKWLFPYVPILLESTSDKGDEEDSTISHMEEYDTHTRRWGFHLLQRLLSSTPENSIQLEGISSFNVTMSVVQVFQFLTNHLLIMNTLAVQQPPLATQQTTDALPSLPTAPIAFAWMKHLLAKYTSLSGQIALVKHLTETCPHEGLKPKFVDLLRPLVAAEGCQIVEVFAYVDEMWGRTMSMCSFQKQSSQEIEWAILVDSCELAVALITLVQLAYRLHGRVDDYAFAHFRGDSLEQLHTALYRNLRQWGGEESDSSTAKISQTQPEEFFRLNLLENALSDLLVVLKQAPHS